MSNHIHLIWQVQAGNKRENVQRDFLKYTSQTIMRDIELNHEPVLKVFEVDAKDRKYQVWQRNPLSIDLWTKEVFIQKMEYIHNNPVTAGICSYPEQYKYSSNFMKQEKIGLDFLRIGLHSSVVGAAKHTKPF